MPANSTKAPRYCRQREKSRPDRAYVVFDGKRVQLGEYGSPESFERYTKAVNERANKPAPPPKPAPTAPTMSVLMVAYLRYAIDKYGEKSNEVVSGKQAFKVLRRTHGDLLAMEFGPKAFQNMRRAMIGMDWSRRYISDQCQRVKRMIAWGIVEEMLPAGARHALDAVPPLARGEFNVRETDEVKPVPDATIDATAEHLSPVVRDMVRLMRLTGMRPAELCQLSNDHLDRRGDVWIFAPPAHKTQRHGKQRTIAIGPKAQAILSKYLFNKPCFKYTTASFRRAIHRACDRAFPNPTLQKLEDLSTAQLCELAEWRSARRWSPNQIRHTAATAIREKFGLEVAQVCLGHSRADVTQIYAEANREKALDLARQIG